MPIPYRVSPQAPQTPDSGALVPQGRTLHLRENTNQPPAEDVAGYTCTLSWQGNTYEFSPDPVRILWGMNAQVNLMVTRGGQVAYSSGRTIGPLTIAGFLRSRWDLLELGALVSQHMRDAQLLGIPARFTYPEREIDYSVYIQNFNEIGLDGEQAEIVAYSFVCVITEDHTALATAEQSSVMAGLPENIEWIDVESAAKIAEERFGRTSGSSTGSASGEETPAEETEVTEE